MRKFYSIALLAFTALSGMGQSKLDLSAKMLIQNYEMIRQGLDKSLFDPRLSESPISRSGESPLIGAIVSLNDGYSAMDAVCDRSVTVAVDLGDMAVMSLPVSLLERLAESPAVKSVSVGTPKQAEMYFARSSGKVNDVQLGTGLEMAYDGSGVIVGMMDQGMDPNHINFSEQSDVNTSRVKAVYAYRNSNGIPTATATTPDAIKTFTTDMSDATHGTHVMGIAAGSYNGEGNYGLSGKTYSNQAIPFYGVATNADIVMAGGVLSDANILAGVQNVVDYAEAAGKPAVINLSLGGILGPHDGSDDMSQSLSRLGEKAIICISAGNEGDADCAMSMSGGRTATSRSNNAVGLNFSSSASSPYTIQFWSNGSEELDFDFVIYSTDTNAVVYSLDVPNNSGNGIGVGGSSMGSAYIKNDYFSQAFTASSYAVFFSKVEKNNRYCVQMQFLLNRSSSSNYSLVPAIRVTRRSGEAVYGYFYTPSNNSTGTFSKPSIEIDGLRWTQTIVSANGSISDMATSPNTIAVGAYTSSSNFTTLTGDIYSYQGATANGEICGFSSYGTNPVTGENYPFICAPGSAIVSSVSNYYTGSQTVSATAGGNGRSNKWGPMQGTSMSCPFVTGTVALWLQADPTLKVDRVKEIIKNTSTPFSGSDSNMKIKWGNGKIDALKGIQEVISTAAIGTVWADDDQRLIVTDSETGYEVFVADGGAVTATLYDLQGRPVARTLGTDGTATVDASSLGHGVYILEARGADYRLTRKVTR